MDVFLDDLKRVGFSGVQNFPTVGLFGPSRPENYRPWGEHAVAVRTEKSYEELVGGPGYDHRTTDTLMESLTVDAVAAAVVALWQRRRQLAAQ